MMGIVIIGLVEFVRKKKGREAVTKILNGSGLTLTSIQEQRIYPNDTFKMIFNNAIEVTQLDKDQFEKEWAKFMTNIVQDKFKGFFDNSKNARELLTKVPDIHFKVFPMIVGHQVKKIVIKDSGDDYITYSYTSPNHLCIFLRTLAQEVLDAYNQNGTIEELQCQKDGAESCRVKVTFNS
jgi:hypothetical protein